MIKMKSFAYNGSLPLCLLSDRVLNLNVKFTHYARGSRISKCTAKLLLSIMFMWAVVVLLSEELKLNRKSLLKF